MTAASATAAASATDKRLVELIDRQTSDVDAARDEKNAAQVALMADSACAVAVATPNVLTLNVQTSTAAAPAVAM
jgi:hypothetical protein